MLVLEELNKRNDVELHIVIGGPALVPKYSSKNAGVKDLLTKEGFQKIHEIHFNLEGDLPIVKGKTTGLGIIEFSTLFNNIKPDIVVVRGDRFEVLAATIAAAYSNIPIAHIEGGDVSGTIDESVRHAISKFSQIHFPTNEESKNRLIRMGESPKYIFNFGSPDVEVAHKLSQNKTKLDLKKTGSGAGINLSKGYIMVMYHPVVTELDNLMSNVKKLLKVIHDLGHQTLWFWPNADVGSEVISSELRVFNDTIKNHKIRFLRDLSPKEFIYLLKNSSCLVGNSSAGIKECSYLGIPVVNVGSRQNKRLRSQNVIETNNSEKAIREAIERQLKAERYRPSKLYKSNNTAKNIAKVLGTVGLYLQKEFNQ